MKAIANADFSPYVPEMPESSQILIVDDEERIRAAYQQLLSAPGRNIEQCGTGEEALRRLERRDVDILILDLNLPDIHGLEIMEWMVQKHVPTAVVVFSGDESIDSTEDDTTAVPHRTAVDSAIAALEHFSRQARAGDLTVFCTIEWDSTRATLQRLGPIMVAGERVDALRLYQTGMEVLDRCSGSAICHGDAHPGNVLFSATKAAILIDYECAGLGPPGYDPSSLWVFAMATHFVAIDDESSLTAMLRELLTGASFTDLCRSWPSTMRPSRNRDLVYLAHRAIGSALSAMEEHGLTREDAYGIMAVILGRELLNPSLQQLVIRCALAAIQSLLKPKTEPACQ